MKFAYATEVRGAVTGVCPRSADRMKTTLAWNDALCFARTSIFKFQLEAEYKPSMSFCTWRKLPYDSSDYAFEQWVKLGLYHSIIDCVTIICGTPRATSQEPCVKTQHSSSSSSSSCSNSNKQLQIHDCTSISRGPVQAGQG